MEIFLFNFDKHAYLIDSFLESAALAHNHSKVKTQEWFYWKFRDNPFGKTILACAKEENKIIGCVAYGMQDFIKDKKTIKGALAFENFVHPNHQRKGVFKKLIELSEKTSKQRQIKVLFVFPNKNSLHGYKKMDWSELESPEYWIKGDNILTIPFAFGKLRNSFQPAESNLSNLSSPVYFQQDLSKNIFRSIINLDYLKWRFFSFPVGEYLIVDTKASYSILRIGNRGSVKETQVLFLNIKDESKFKFSKFIKECKLKSNYDVISFPISKQNPIRKYLIKSFFLKVPNQTNICYKILNPENIKDSDVRSLSISAINYHTY